MELTRSEKLYEKARKLIPGGVSSPVRAIKPFPFYTESASGSKISDADGNEYIDFCLAYGPKILGHANPKIKQAIIEQLDKGWLYGTPTELEITSVICIYYYSFPGSYQYRITLKPHPATHHRSFLQRYAVLL